MKRLIKLTIGIITVALMNITCIFADIAIEPDPKEVIQNFFPMIIGALVLVSVAIVIILIIRRKNDNSY